jgi:hypothetical protein
MVKMHYAEFYTALVVSNQRYNQSLSNNYAIPFLESSKRIPNNYDCPFPKLNKKVSSNDAVPFGRKESDSEHSAQKFSQENSQLSTIPSCATVSCNIHIHFTQPIVVPTNRIS